MTKKRVKRSAVGRAPQAKASPEKTEVQSEVQEVALKAEYIFQQDYEVIVDEQLIEEEWASHFAAEDQESVQEDVVRFKRMLGAIAANQKVLLEIFEWLVLAEVDSANAGSYVSDHYGKDREFFDILMERIDLFAPEDKEWLLWLVRCEKEKEDFDLYTQIVGLRVAFVVIPGGFRVGMRA